MKYIKEFKELTKDDIALVGGKGANLAEMENAGLPIPPGFCVTASAYAEFVAPIQNQITSLLSGLDIENTVELEETALKIQELILKQEMLSQVSEEIKKAYGSLKGFVAVRSSATAEDLPEASFAGQQASFLNVKDDVVQKVQECWASLYTARAIYYREKNNFKHEDVLIAVVVQKMVDAKKAGVMFTVNPVTNSTDEIVIEACFGLGELLVSGQITPDYYCVEKFNLNIKEKNINEQEHGLFREKGENVQKKIEDPEESVLTDEEVLELTKLGDKIEKHYKKPMDIEFAIDDKIYIVQARPVTTLR